MLLNKQSLAEKVAKWSSDWIILLRSMVLDAFWSWSKVYEQTLALWFQSSETKKFLRNESIEKLENDTKNDDSEPEFDENLSTASIDVLTESNSILDQMLDDILSEFNGSL